MFNPVLFYEAGKARTRVFTAFFDTTKTSAGSTASNQLKIPFHNANFVQVVIDWGDGNITPIPTYNHANTTHTYTVAGVYTVKITGTFGIRFTDTGDKLKIISVESWGAHDFYDNAYNGCANLTQIASDVDKLNTIDFFGAGFRNCPLQRLPDNLHFNNATILSNVFQGSKFPTLVSGMLLNSLTNGSFMFYASMLQSLPSGMTLNRLEIGTNMFYNCKLTDLPMGMTLKSLKAGAGMFFGNTINTARYSQLLIDMAALNPNNNVPFHGGNSKYNSSAVSARNALIARGWTISDGGII